MKHEVLTNIRSLELFSPVLLNPEGLRQRLSDPKSQARCGRALLKRAAVWKSAPPEVMFEALVRWYVEVGTGGWLVRPVARVRPLKDECLIKEKETRQLFLPPSSSEDAARRQLSACQKEGSHQSLATLHPEVGPLTSRTMRNTVLLFKSPSLWCLS